MAIHDLSELNNRLEKLECEVASLKQQRRIVMGVVAFGFTALIATSAMTQTAAKKAPHLVCRSLTVVGGNGKKIVGLGADSDDGAGSMRLLSKDGKSTVLIGSSQNHGGAFTLWDQEQRPRISMDEKHLELSDRNFAGRVDLSTNEEGGKITINGQKQTGFPLWQAGASREGGYMTIHAPATKSYNVLRLWAHVTPQGGHLQTFKTPELSDDVEQHVSGSVPEEK